MRKYLNLMFKLSGGTFAAMCAVPAPAQSSVTIFGVVDTAYAYGSGSMSHISRLKPGANNSARLGFRGTEDLGGGLAASFWLEMGINTDDGTGVASNANNTPAGAGSGQGVAFNRRSTASLTSTSLGEIRLGRDFTASYLTRFQPDPWGDVGVGASRATSASILGVTSTRVSNAISYITPTNLGGFYGQAQHYFGENASNVANSHDGDGNSARIGYSSGPIDLSVARGVTKYGASATIGKTTSDNVAGTYDFGAVKLYAGAFRDRLDRTVALTGKSYTFGASAPVGAWEFRSSLSRFGSDAPGKPAANQLAIGVVYNLSKRTAVYGTIAALNNKGGSTQSLNASVTGANRNSRGVDLGIRHRF